MDKVTRMLFLYSKLINGEKISKTIFCFENDCAPRTFDRDIEDTRLYLSESLICKELKYDRRNDTYYIDSIGKHELEETEILFVERILKDATILRKDELDILLSHLRSNTNNQKGILKNIQNNAETYESPIHNKALLKIHGDLVTIIQQKKCITIEYEKQNGVVIKKKILPCSIRFDFGYLYLIGYRYGEDDEYPVFYRLDRIHSFTIDRNLLRDEKDKINMYMKNYANAITQMFGGDYVRVELKCRKIYFSYLHDKFRKIEIIAEGGDDISVRIAVFENGFIKWMLSQPQEMYTIIKPDSTKEKLVQEAKKIVEKYGGVTDGKKN